ncbi:HU family DNA-binding protein [Aestuariivivens sediminis]|uniref:HU family DNA-binding protein n=1 Tax=Aestuariivivens sediminis TaxID=2913557 RepID=UPI001F566AF0|nr:HU family DNA-binding protein [Aestuariivivens sediminis]
MSIKFRAIERGEPGVAGGGVKKWYASPVFQGESDMERLIKSIEKISTVSGADIRGVLYALVDVSIDALEHGQIVRIGDLGNLRVNLSSSSADTEEEVVAGNIKRGKIIFTPGSRLKDMLNTLKFVKV